MVDADAFNLKQNFPIASVAQLYADRPTKEAAIKAQQQKTLLEGLEMFGKSVDSIVQRREQMAQALAVRKALGINDPSGEMTADQAVSVHKETAPIAVPYMDKDGNVQILNLPRGSKGLPSTGTAGVAQQTYSVDEKTGFPLLLNRRTGELYPATPAAGVKPVAAKGTGEAVNMATGLATALPLIDQVYDKFDKLAAGTRNGRNVKTFVAGQHGTIGGMVKGLVFPELKALEDSIIASRSFAEAGKNFTSMEKQVVLDAMLPTGTDNGESREIKRNIQTGITSGKLSMLEAARLLGPAGAQARQIIEKYNASQAPSSPVQKQPPPSDVVHLSTAELQNLRKKLTAHKDNAHKS